MTDPELDILADKISQRMAFQPRWLKLKQASAYASIGQKKLKTLADDGEIIGYPDPDSKRGDWVFDRKSIDHYRLRPIAETNIRFKKILDDLRR